MTNPGRLLTSAALAAQRTAIGRQSTRQSILTARRAAALTHINISDHILLIVLTCFVQHGDMAPISSRQEAKQQMQLA
jgi:hypothetical protein